MGSGDPTGSVPADGSGIARIDALCALAVRSLPVDGASVTLAVGAKLLTIK